MYNFGTLNDGVALEPTNAAQPPAAEPALVRVATGKDEAAIYDALAALHADGDMDLAALTPEKVRLRIAAGASLGESTGGIIGVLDGAKGIVAATVGIFPVQLWYSDDVYLHQDWLFVRPVYRGLGYEKALFEFAENFRREISDGMGREIKLMSIVNGTDRLPAKMRLWSRLGRQIGAVFDMGRPY